MRNDELCWMTASDLAAAIRRKKVSPAEVIDAGLDRIERLRALNAYHYFLINADGTGERRVVRGGFYPTWMRTVERWSACGSGGSSANDLAAQRETLILDGPKEFPGVGELGAVELAPDGRRPPAHRYERATPGELVHVMSRNWGGSGGWGIASPATAAIGSW